MCVVSAVVAVCVILAAALTQIFLFYFNPSLLAWDKRIFVVEPTTLDEPGNSTIDETFVTTIIQILNETLVNETLSINNTTTTTTNTITEKEPNGIGLGNTVFLIVTAVIVILAAVTAGLLLHLCFFHIYISYLGLTTYEYIRNHRQNVTNAKGQGPSLKTTKNRAKEIYGCSRIKVSNAQHRPKTLHCCEMSQDAHSEASTTAETSTEISHKAIYLCTVLEETRNTSTSTHDKAAASTRTFHCCSEFSHTTQSQSHYCAQKIVQYTEQCSFCRFRIKTSKRQDNGGKHCCVKAITKHHRWRRKWNCCSNVPNSPEDLPEDSIRIRSLPITASTTITDDDDEVPFDANNVGQNNLIIENNQITAIEVAAHEPSNGSSTIIQIADSQSNNSNIVASSSSNDFVTTISSQVSGTNNSPTTPKIRKKVRSKLIRPWPRLRHMFHMINRYRGPRCHGNNLKQNQIRPLSTSHSSENMNGESQRPKRSAQQSNAVPSAPAPNRRKIKNSNDLQDLAESLSIIQPASFQISQIQSIRRQRRKNVLRNRSPTLSPIHESGLSNPTSPQLTHACRQCSASILSMGNSSAVCGSPVGNGDRIE